MSKDKIIDNDWEALEPKSESIEKNAIDKAIDEAMAEAYMKDTTPEETVKESEIDDEPIQDNGESEEIVSEDTETGDATEESVSEENVSEDIDQGPAISKEKKALANAVFAEKEDNEDNKAGVGLKIIGTISLIASIAGLALIGLCVYFMILKPGYDKGSEGGQNIVYSEYASVSDASYEEQKQLLEMISTATDATPTDATATDATATDSEASDAE